MEKGAGGFRMKGLNPQNKLDRRWLWKPIREIENHLGWRLGELVSGVPVPTPSAFRTNRHLLPPFEWLLMYFETSGISLFAVNLGPIARRNPIFCGL